MYTVFVNTTRDSALLRSHINSVTDRILRNLLKPLIVLFIKTCHSISLSRAQELCGSRRGRPGLPVPNKPDGFCGRKVTLNKIISQLISPYTSSHSLRSVGEAILDVPQPMDCKGKRCGQRG